MNLVPGDDFLDMLMSGRGQEYLDREIQKLRLDIGEQQFQEFAHEYFKNEGQPNIYAIKPQTKTKGTKEGNREIQNIIKQQELKEEQKQKQKQQMDVFVSVSGEEEKKYLEQSPKQQDNQLQHQYSNIEQTTNNQQSQGLVQISRTQLTDGNTKVTYNNGDYYEGEVEGDRKNGWGTYYYSNGEKYSGIFVDDQIHGYGRYYFLNGAQYEGDWSSGMKHGIGILKFGNQDVYEGGFCKDDFHGNGVYKYHNGGVFEGKWKWGKKNGRGEFHGADGHVQIGDWVDDKFQI